MGLNENIISIKPREISGSITSSRYSFQYDFSLSQLLETHNKENDYLFLFDYHEDLILMESESNPQSINFFQIKGKEKGNWTLSNLIKSGKNAKGEILLSIIGKLYQNKINFPKETKSLNFVTNANFSLLDKNKKSFREQICIIELSPKDKQSIHDALTKELSLTTTPAFEDITFLKITNLSLNDSSTHVKGKLVDFLDKENPNAHGKFMLQTIYNHLLEEIKRRTNFHDSVLSFEDLKNKKGISKRIFSQWIETLGVYKDYTAMWNEINHILSVEGWTYKQRSDLKREFNQYEIDSKNPTHEMLSKIKQEIKHICATSQNIINEMSNLSARIEYVYSIYPQKTHEEKFFNKDYILSIIIDQLYE